MIIADRAYGTLKSIGYLEEKGADFIIRMRPNYFCLYNETRERVSLLDYFEGLTENENQDVVLYHKSDDGYRPIRICAIRKTRESELKGMEQIKKSNTKSIFTDGTQTVTLRDDGTFTAKLCR